MQKMIRYSGSIFLLFYSPVYASYNGAQNNSYVIMGKESELVIAQNEKVDFFELSKKYDKSKEPPREDWGGELLSNWKPYYPEQYKK